VLPTLAKAEKWLYVKRDTDYCFLWMMHVVEALARIEVLRHGEVPGREVIHQALRHNGDLFRTLYTDLIHGPKNETTLKNALRRVHDYLDAHAATIFRPILDYLREEGVARTTTELDEHFRARMGTGFATAYEWLAEQGVLVKVGAPIRLTEKSRVTVDEAAYFFEGDAFA
jgi:hypothetical protein